MPARRTSDGGRPGRLSGNLALMLGLAAPLCAMGGAYLANSGRLSPFVGFRMFLVASPLAVAAILIAFVAMFRGRGGRSRTARAKGLAGITFAIVTMSAVVGLALPSASYPLINDITTDLDDPPGFAAAARLPANRGRDMSYPEEFAAEQKRAYPTLGFEVLSVSPDQALERVRAALESLPNTRVIDVSPEDGRVEAVSVSSVFHFVDDVVVRVREVPGGSRIDIRSKSRDGRGDLGANAHRIETLLTILH